MMIYYDPEVQAVIISQQPEDKYAALDTFVQEVWDQSTHTKINK